MKKLIILMAILSPAISYAEVDSYTKVKELSDSISATVLGYCAGLHLKTSDEQVACINNGYDMALKAIENSQEVAITKQ